MSDDTPTQQSFNEAQRFLQDTLNDTALAQSYSAAIQTAASNNDTAGPTNWLVSQGYQTTATQVSQAQE